MDKKVQALITDMNQPLGYAVGNALEIMEGLRRPAERWPGRSHQDLKAAAHDLLGQEGAARGSPHRRKDLVDGSAYQWYKKGAKAAHRRALDKFELLPNATCMREVTSPRAGYVAAINAEDIGTASNMIGAGRDKKEDAIDPAVGIILEVKTGEKVDAGSVLCRLYYTKEDRVEEAAEMVEDAFRVSTQKPDERELILEVVG
jgi:thymidine phosphorylase